jgi:hypothetical protein
MGEVRKLYRVLVGKHEGNRPLERARQIRGWDGGVEWIQLAQDRDRWWYVMNTARDLWVLVPWS